jgi:hypothetical protein
MHHHTLRFLAAAVLLMAACSDDSTVVDSTLNESAILLTDLQLSHYTVDTDTVDVKAGQTKSADDPVVIPFTLRVRVSGATRVGSLRYEIRLDGKTPLLASGVLQPASQSDVWEAAVRFDRKRGDVGDYRIDVFGWDDTGHGANTANAKLRVLFGSRPPEIRSINAPDTVDLQPETVVFTMSAEVYDPSGQADIRQVFFNSFLPDGRPSSGNPFTMRDDGQPGSGDAVAGDGLYSIKVQMPPDTPKGEYRFEFRALDYSSLSSNVVIHKLTVR